MSQGRGTEGRFDPALGVACERSARGAGRHPPREGASARVEHGIRARAGAATRDAADTSARPMPDAARASRWASVTCQTSRLAPERAPPLTFALADIGSAPPKREETLPWAFS